MWCRSLYALQRVAPMTKWAVTHAAFSATHATSQAKECQLHVSSLQDLSMTFFPLVMEQENLASQPSRYWDYKLWTMALTPSASSYKGRSWANHWLENSYGYIVAIALVQLLSHVQLFATPWTAACQVALSFTISLNLLKLMSIEAFLVVQSVKNPPAMWETSVRSLGWEDPLEGGHGKTLQYSCLENPVARGTWRSAVQRVGHNWVTKHSTQHICTESVMPPNHLILCHLLLLLPSILPIIRFCFFPPWVAAKALKLQLQHQPVLPTNTQGWFPLGLTGLISLLSKGLLRVFSNTTNSKVSIWIVILL